MPFPLLLDEDLRDAALWRAIESYCRANPDWQLDILRVGDVGAPPPGTYDPDLLRWAIGQQRVIVTHDRNTMIAGHRALVAVGWRTPDLLVVRDGYSYDAVAEAIALAAHCLAPAELQSGEYWIPE